MGIPGGPSLTDPMVPSPLEVHGLSPTRWPQFDDDSAPSAAEVLEIAQSIARSLLLEFPPGTTLTDPQVEVARQYVRYATGARVEWGWYPEQQDADGLGARLDMWAGVELARLRGSLGSDADGSTGDWSGTISARGRR